MSDTELRRVLNGFGWAMLSDDERHNILDSAGKMCDLRGKLPKSVEASCKGEDR